MPWAPNLRARAASSGVSALVRIPSLRYLSHMPMNFAKSGFSEASIVSEQADALGAELEGAGGVLRGVGVGADTELAVLVAHAHELGEERVLGGVHRVDGAAVDETLGAVQAQEVTLLEGLVDAGEGDGLVLEV